MKKWPDGKIVWVFGRAGSGKSTLARELKDYRPNLVIIDDHLRKRVGISGSSHKAYIKMCSLAGALAFQGLNVVICAGCPFRSLRDELRSLLPGCRFVYLGGRGREYKGFEEPFPDEKDIISLVPGSKPAREALNWMWGESGISGANKRDT